MRRTSATLSVAPFAIRPAIGDRWDVEQAITKACVDSGWGHQFRQRMRQVIIASCAAQVCSASVPVVSRREQIEYGSVSSVRQAAAASNVSGPVVERWLSFG